MTGWKQNVRVGDLDSGQKLEMRCWMCAHVPYMTRELICVSSERELLYLDEVERKGFHRARLPRLGSAVDGAGRAVQRLRRRDGVTTTS